MSEEEKTQKPELKKISREELKEILKAHAKWVEDGCDPQIPGQADLSMINLRGADLEKVNLKKALLLWTDFEGAHLEGANFQGATLPHANFKEALLKGAFFQEASLIYTNLEGADLRATNFVNSILQNSVLDSAWLVDSVLDGANLKHAHLRFCRLNNSSLVNSDLEYAELIGATCDNACFNNAKLRGANFTDARLKNVTMNNVDLFQAIFRNAWLRMGNIQGSVLAEADFSQANLSKAALINCYLHHANFRKSFYLSTRILAGSDLYATLLPADLAKFDGLESIKEAAEKGSHLFTILLLCCLFSWLTVGFGVIAPKDGSYLLPLMQNASVQESGFLLLAPAFILSLFFYFQMYLQRLWEQLALMPAIFPDGSPLDKKAHPWLPIGYVRAHVKVLREAKNKPPFSWLQARLIELIVYIFPPVSIGLFWYRGLNKGSDAVSLFQAALTWAACLVAVSFLGQAQRTLRREDEDQTSDDPQPTKPPRPTFEKIISFVGSYDWQINLMAWLTSFFAMIHLGFFKL